MKVLIFVLGIAAAVVILAAIVSIMIYDKNRIKNEAVENEQRKNSKLAEETEKANQIKAAADTGNNSSDLDFMASQLHEYASRNR